MTEVCSRTQTPSNSIKRGRQLLKAHLMVRLYQIISANRIQLQKNLYNLPDMVLVPLLYLTSCNTGDTSYMTGAAGCLH